MEEQTINQLLNTNFITVPEIQREYVWGSNQSLLERFLDDIVAMLSSDKTYNIGFLYSYKHSACEEYLIDGQQRFTTLMLLAIYLSKFENKISTMDALLKVKEPQQTFTYRVRTSAATFLHSLCLYDFDVKHGGRLTEKIMAKTWYISKTYNKDTTVQNMLKTLDIIHHWFKGNGPEKLSLEDVLNRVTFWRFKTDLTGQGEELYISMNSRGCPLNETEQIKPLLFEKIDNQTKKYREFGKKWDDWENFFFTKRQNSDISSVDTAMTMMIRMIVELKACKQRNELKPREDIEYLSLEDIEEYMDVLQKLYDKGYEKEVKELYAGKGADVRLHVLKALVVEYMRGRDDERELKRIISIVNNGLRRNKINHVPFLKFLRDYASDKISSFYEFVVANAEKHYAVFNGHELDKIVMYSKASDDNLEDTCWDAEAHILWEGNIRILLDWSKDEGGSVGLATLQKYKKTIELLFANQKGHPGVWDETRRALMSRQLKNYPLTNHFRYARFGYESEEWRKILEGNADAIKTFLDEVYGLDEVTEKTVEGLIRKGGEYSFKEVADHDYLLKYCNYKHFFLHERYGWLLVKNMRAKPISVFNKHLSVSAHKESLFTTNGWGVREWYNYGSCVVIENGNINIAFDLWKEKANDGKTICKVQMFRRQNETGLDKLFKTSITWKACEPGTYGKVESYMFEDESDDMVISQIMVMINDCI